MGEVNVFTVEWLQESLKRQAAYAERAVALGERIRSYSGAAAAIEAIER